jgi:cell division protease FtsH
MSDELGLMAPAVVQNRYLEGSAQMDCSQETAAKVDAAVQKLLTESYEAAVQTLKDNRSLLDEISDYLLTKETITGEELMKFVNADRTAEETPSEETVTEETPAEE